jgi:hypothetical protein
MSALTQQINATSGGVIRVPYGTYNIDEPINVRSAVIIEPGTTLNVGHRITLKNGAVWATENGRHGIVKTGGDHLFYMAGSNLEVNGIFTDELPSTGGYVFMIDTAQGRERLRISNIKTYHSRGLISDTNNTAGVIVDLRLDNVMARLHRGRGSYLTRAFAYIFLRQCTIDYVGATDPASTNIPAWVFFNAEGLEFDSVDVLGTVNAAPAGSQHGFYLDNVRALTIKQAMADNVGGFGFYFTNCQYIDAAIIKASLGGGCAIVAANGTTDLRINLLYLSGRNGLPNNANSPLIYTDNTIINCHASQLIAERYSTLFAGSGFTVTKQFTRP